MALSTTGNTRQARRVLRATAPAGAAQTSTPDADRERPDDTTDPAIAELFDIAEEVSGDLDRLAAISQAEGPEPRVYDVPERSPLQETITLRWSGPVEPVVQSIATMVGYEFSVVGDAPLRERIVNLDVSDQPAFAVLQNIGHQVGNKVTVIADDEQRTLSVAYGSDYDRNSAPGEGECGLRYPHDRRIGRLGGNPRVSITLERCQGIVLARAL